MVILFILMYSSSIAMQINKTVIMQQIFHEFMCSYTILKNFVDKRNKLGLNFVIPVRNARDFF